MRTRTINSQKSTFHQNMSQIKRETFRHFYTSNPKLLFKIQISLANKVRSKNKAPSCIHCSTAGVHTVVDFTSFPSGRFTTVHKMARANLNENKTF